ncbi:hypothetical protein MNBD_ALPHA07-2414 [hydrothermal vent metagenome]|uniref:HTH arsR-type domain-containing protein n=1 Tax=hydrothermal vent metagenome TaxID=652676 RepID=A0A3B0S9V4_9ZZZZ
MDQEQAIECFSAMAQETRLAILKLLMRKSPDGIRVSDISGKLDIVPSTLSGHLSVLRRSGLLNSNRNQREIFYSADLETINDLMLFIVEECCDGNLDSCEKTFRLLLSKTEKV